MPVAVVGAGLAGLVAALELRRAGAEVIVLEQEQRAGGIVRTELVDDGGRWVVEGGPDGFLATDPEIPALAEQLGVRDRLIEQAARGAQLWTGRELAPLRSGEAAAVLGIDVPADAVAAGFRSFVAGMGELVEALSGALGPGVIHHAGVTAAQPRSRGYRLAVTGGSELLVEGLVLAVPAPALARLLTGIDSAAARAIGQLRYRASLTVSLAYTDRQLGRALEGTGFVTARETPDPLRACTFAWRKFPGRAPEGHALMRAFLAWGEAEASSLAHARLAAALGIVGPPRWTRVFHWPRGIPCYAADHAARMGWVRRRLQRAAPVTLAGAACDGAGVAACVRSGRRAADELLQRSRA